MAVLVLVEELVVLDMVTIDPTGWYRAEIPGAGGVTMDSISSRTVQMILTAAEKRLLR